MNIRKFLNLQSQSQNDVIISEIATIMMKCSVIANTEQNDLQESKRIHDNTCCKCRNQKNIVDKVSHVHGKYVVINNTLFGSKGVGSNVIIDTEPINHCNDCGHEWIKFKTKRIKADDIVRVALNYYCQLESNPSERVHEWKLDAIRVFDNCHAESIYRLSIKHRKYLNKLHLSKFHLKNLRIKYKSIFDTTAVTISQ